MPPATTATEAVVLGSIDLGERDRVVRLLTPDLGRVSALARGARGSRRRFAGALDLAHHIRVRLRSGRGDLRFLEEAEVLGDRLRLRSDLLGMALASYACELVGSLAAEDHPEPRLFGLLVVSLAVLDASQARPRSAFRAGLEVKALAVAGVGPRLTSCARCGEPLTLDCAFDPAAGGALHPGCGPGEPVARRHLDDLERARRTRLVELLDEDLAPGPPWLLADFAEYHLGRRLMSRSWLTTVEAT